MHGANVSFHMKFQSNAFAAHATCELCNRATSGVKLNLAQKRICKFFFDAFLPRALPLSSCDIMYYWIAYVRKAKQKSKLVKAGVIGALCAFHILLQTASAAAKEIRVAVPDLSAGTKPSAGGIVDVMYSQKLLEQEFANDGIKITWIFLKGAGPVINEALANGQVDFAYLGDLPAIIGKSGGLDTRLLSAIVRRTKFYLGVIPDSKITSLSDLKGRRVGILRGTVPQLSFANALSSKGLSERDVKVVNLDGSAISAALISKQIDATWGGIKLIDLRNKGVVELPLNSNDIHNSIYTQGVLLGDGKFVDANPSLVKRFLNAQHKAQRWLIDEKNKSAYFTLVASQSSIPLTLLKADQENDDFSQIYSVELDDDFLKNLQGNVDSALKLGLIRKGFDVQEWSALSVDARKSVAHTDPTHSAAPQ